MANAVEQETGSQNVCVGLLVGDITNPFFSGLTRSIGRALRQSGGHTLLVADAQDDAALQVTLADELRARGAQALIVTVPHAPELLNQDRGPVVGVDRCNGVPYVTADNLLGGRLATQHLFKQGYQRPGILHAMSTFASVQDRIQGYRHALRLAGREPDSALEIDCGALTYEAAVAGATSLLEAGADAIFGINDVLASGAVTAAARAQREIPAQVGVVGYDDTPMAAWPSLDLTSVAQDIAEIGRSAASMALRLVERNTARIEPTVLPPRLVARGSTRRAA